MASDDPPAAPAPPPAEAAGIPSSARRAMSPMSETDDLTYVEMSPEFGSAWPNGSCNALVDGQVCGWPRREDGTCHQGHPPEPTP